MPPLDEGFTEEDLNMGSLGVLDAACGTVREREGNLGSFLLSERLSDMFSEDLAYQLLASLPRARLAVIQRKIAPLLQFDVVGVRISSSCMSGIAH